MINGLLEERFNVKVGQVVFFLGLKERKCYSVYRQDMKMLPRLSTHVFLHVITVIDIT